MKELLDNFIRTLQKRFGKYDEEHFRFEKSSNTEIARELGYSDAQFSRLIHGSATEGEYQRANQNLARIILIDKLESKLENVRGQNSKSRWMLPLGIVLLITIVSCFYLLHKNSQLKEESQQQITSNNRLATLKWAFETSQVKPYVSLNDLPDDCNYPCYKYQGKWILDETYKIPFFREKNGYHYLAKEVTMYARCMSEENNSGNMLEGYEYQKHEIWYDKRELPLDSFIIDGGLVKVEYEKMKFEDDQNFIKVANVHTFFRNEFYLQDSIIQRRGKVIGRDVEAVSTQELENSLNADKVLEINENLQQIISNRLEDFSRPISCNDAIVPSDDFHLVADGDKMSYSCSLTTSRVALNYNKAYILEDQYIKNKCFSAE